MTDEGIELLCAVLHGVPALPLAACRGRSQVFDADTDDNATTALRICHTCPEAIPCASWASTLTHTGRNGINGVVGGQHRIWVSHKSEIGRRAPVVLHLEEVTR